jgi:hypothetical protein
MVNVFVMPKPSGNLQGDYYGDDETTTYDPQSSIFTNQYYYMVYSEATYSNTVLTPMMGTTNLTPVNWGPIPADGKLFNTGYMVQDVFFIAQYDYGTNGFKYK